MHLPQGSELVLSSSTAGPLGSADDRHGLESERAETRESFPEPGLCTGVLKRTQGWVCGQGFRVLHAEDITRCEGRWATRGGDSDRAGKKDREQEGVGETRQAEHDLMSRFIAVSLGCSGSAFRPALVRSLALQAFLVPCICLVGFSPYSRFKNMIWTWRAVHAFN